jgi:hypothetical protein
MVRRSIERREKKFVEAPRSRTANRDLESASATILFRCNVPSGMKPPICLSSRQEIAVRGLLRPPSDREGYLLATAKPPAKKETVSGNRRNWSGEN